MGVVIRADFSRGRLNECRDPRWICECGWRFPIGVFDVEASKRKRGGTFMFVCPACNIAWVIDTVLRNGFFEISPPERAVP